MRGPYNSVLVHYHSVHGEQGKSWFRNVKRLIQEHTTLLVVIVAAVIFASTIYLAGLMTLLAEDDFSKFTHPLNIENFDRFVATIDETIQKEHKSGLNYDTISEALVKIKKIEPNRDYILPLVQFKNLTFLIDTSTSCTSHWNKTSNDDDDDRSKTVIIVVKSAVNNYARRRAIRDTWFANATMPNQQLKFKTVFMVGACDKLNPIPKSLKKQLADNSTWTPEDCQQAVKEEALKHGDLVQSSGVDSYYNNTLKTVMILRWVGERCKSDFFLALDDDFVFEVSNFDQYLELLAVESQLGLGQVANATITNLALGELTHQLLYAGYLRDYVRPHRHVLGKWYISREEYAYNKYPRFVTGGSVLMSHRMVRYFAIASYFTKTFKFDDVYVGIMAHKLQVEPIHEARFMCNLENYLTDERIRINSSDCIGVLDIEPTKLVEFWKQRHNVHQSEPHMAGNNVTHFKN